MKSDNLLRHVAIPFVIAVTLYATFYTWIEHTRDRKGPWQVTFADKGSGAAALIINQPKLAITNFEIDVSGVTNQIPATSNSWSFAQPREVPFDVPFGKCVFMDTTFLPGTIVFHIGGHEIELIPRVLMIDRKEIPWRSNTALNL